MSKVVFIALALSGAVALASADPVKLEAQNEFRWPSKEKEAAELGPELAPHFKDICLEARKDFGVYMNGIGITRAKRMFMLFVDFAIRLLRTVYEAERTCLQVPLDGQKPIYDTCSRLKVDELVRPTFQAMREELTETLTNEHLIEHTKELSTKLKIASLKAPHNALHYKVQIRKKELLPSLPDDQRRALEQKIGTWGDADCSLNKLMRLYHKGYGWYEGTHGLPIGELIHL